MYVIEPELLEQIPPDTVIDFGKQMWPNLVRPGKRSTRTRRWPTGTTSANSTSSATRSWTRCSATSGSTFRAKRSRPGSGRRRVPDRTRARTVEGPVVLGRNVAVEEDALIRGPAAIGADCRVGAAPLSARLRCSRKRRARRGNRDRRDLRRRLEARREHPALPVRAELRRKSAMRWGREKPAGDRRRLVSAITTASAPSI